MGLLATGAVLLAAMSGGCGNHRQHMARSQLRLLATTIDAFRERTGRLPATLDVLASGEHDGPWTKRRALIDPWDRPFYYRADETGFSYMLFTLGADGQLGGDGHARDIDANDAMQPRDR